MDKRKAYFKRLVSISTVFRNLSAATVENQQWLGKNAGYALRVSPFEPVDDDADAVEDDDSSKIDIKNADLFAECQGELDSLLTVCVKVLPQCGGWPPNGTADDSVCWKLAMSCL
ncbi:hypothetical protein BDR26DRAFT_936466 [Obelidium mucronatum]|nr:hypothetical protein BDR26DRAFT_936466 [Obelidium mucronatum]